VKALSQVIRFLKGGPAPRAAQFARQTWLQSLPPVDAIIESGLFDHRTYAAAAGTAAVGRDLVEHYLDGGARKGLSPHPDFDPTFYLDHYPDVAEAGMDPLLHFIRYGQFEMRCPSMRRARAELEIIRRSGQFDPYTYEVSRLEGGVATPSAGLDADILDYLIYGAGRNNLPKADFDPLFFALYYEYLLAGRISSFALYCQHHTKAWCVPNPYYLTDEAELIARSPLFDREWYRTTYLADRPSVDEVLHYCTEGFVTGTDPSPKFGSRYYLRRYRDIQEVEITPLGHYLRNGESEGRLPGLDPAAEIVDGERTFDPALPTVVILSHEASRTGAPIVALGLVQSMHKWANVISWVGSDGPLTPSFEADSVACVRKLGEEADNIIVVEKLAERFKIDFAVLNSVVSSRAATGFRLQSIPVVSLIHEFAEYVRPRGWATSMVLNSSVSVLPAELVKDSLVHEFDELRLPVQNPKIVIRHQGRYDLRTMATNEQKTRSLTAEQVLMRIGVRPGMEKPIIVLGAGWVQPRKGVDLFVEVARNVKQITDRPIKFIWVGGNYNPDRDMVYSVYIADQVARSGLSDSMHFFGEQPDLDAFWAVADVFLMSSRLDPFPNVVLDAIAEQVATVCFDRTTGCVELARPDSPALTVVPYNDCGAAARAIVGLTEDREAVSAALAAERDYWAERFSKDGYARDVFDLGMRAREEASALAATVTELHESGDLDPAFCAFGWPRWAELPTPDIFVPRDSTELNFANAVRGGFPFARPAPGRRYDRDSGKIVIDDAGVHFLSGEPVRVPADGPTPPDGGSLGLHIHVANDKSLDILTQIVERPSAARYVVTTADDAIAEQLEPVVTLHPERVTLRCDEVFRDPVVAYLTVLGSDFADCDLVGSLPQLPSTEESRGYAKQIAAVQRLFMTDPAIVEPVFRHIESDPNLALCFAEQPRVPGSPTMLAVADELAAAVGLDLAGLGDVRVPLDNTFWVRPRLLPLLADSRLLDRAAALAPRTTQILLIDGFCRFLVGLCRRTGVGAEAVYAPSAIDRFARPAYRRPLDYGL